jgi:hypothetical protein
LIVITADQAVDVAKQAGLTLEDARALFALADNLEHARRLAERFAAPAVLETRVGA